jgi:long-subunit fatty acid transport protein
MKQQIVMIQRVTVSVFLCFSLVICSGYKTCSFAQPGSIELYPVGAGARANGMGGAFIAIADDATAASWNPAGIYQLKYREVSAVFDGIYRREKNEFLTNPEADDTETTEAYKQNFLDRFNFFSFTFPVCFRNRESVLSLNYQKLYDFTVDWDYSTKNRRIKFKQNGKLSALGLAFSFPVLRQLYLGIALNTLNDNISKNRWGNENWEWSPIDSQPIKTAKQYSVDGFNWGANFGIMYKNKGLKLGGVYKTNIKDADLEIKENDEPSDFYTMDMPESWGLGIAYTFFDGFTMALDIAKTRWDHFFLSKGGSEWSGVSGLLKKSSDIDPTWQIRIGAEYIFGAEYELPADWTIPARIGFFYEQVPAEKVPDDYYGVSLGIGGVRKIKESGYFPRCSFDLACQYRWGTNVRDDILQEYIFSQPLVQEYRVYFSLIIYAD